MDTYDLNNDDLCMNKNLDMHLINDKVTIYNKLTKKTYVLGNDEYEILRNMDGTKSIKALSKISQKYSEEDIYQLANLFMEMNFLVKRAKKKRRLRDFWKMKLSILNGNSLLKPDSIFTKFYYFTVTYLSIPLFLLGFITYYFRVGLSFAVVMQLRNASIPLMIGIFLASAVVHEFSHAVVARKYNIPVPDMGLLFYCFIPYPYTNLTYISLLEKKIKKINSLLAGIFSNMLISGICLILVSFCKSQRVILLLNIVGIMNLAFVITNLMVFFKLDGYFVMLIGMDENHLRERAMGKVIQAVMNLPSAIREGRNQVREKNISTTHTNELFSNIFGMLSIFYVPVLIAMTLITVIHNLINFMR